MLRQQLKTSGLLVRDLSLKSVYVWGWGGGGYSMRRQRRKQKMESNSATQILANFPHNYTFLIIKKKAKCIPKKGGHLVRDCPKMVLNYQKGGFFGEGESKKGSIGESMQVNNGGQFVLAPRVTNF